MLEKDIRPVELMGKYWELVAKDSNRLLEKINEFVYVPCPACLNSNFVISFEKKGFYFVMCNDCKTLFVNPRPTFEMLNDFYGSSECIKYWNDHIFPQSEKVRFTKIFKPRAKKIKSLLKQIGSFECEELLDVGAGNGLFCYAMKQEKIFKRIFALEPSSSFAETCRDKGLDVIEKMIEDFHSNEKFDVITNFELIEHLFNPKKFLEKCNDVLKQNGILILTTPNISGFDLAILGKESNNIVGPNHLNYFNSKSLSLLLKKCNFEILEISTPGKLDAELVRTAALENKIDLKKQPFLKQILLDEWEKLSKSFQQFLVKNNLSSHLWIVARKNKKT